MAFAFNKKQTILDLDEKYWRVILDYMPVQDLIRTERTSKAWQRKILSYLSSARITIGPDKPENPNDRHNFVYLSEEEDFPSVKLWSRKLGHAVFSFNKYSGGVDDCMSLHTMFPNLEELELLHVKLHKGKFPSNAEEYFPNLKRLSFVSCEGDTDEVISKFVTNSNLEYLKIFFNQHMTGQCLVNIKCTNLKSLVLRSCRRLQLATLESIADRLGGLKKFVLARTRSRIRDRIPLLLAKMPNLEYLTIRVTTPANETDEKNVSNVFYGAVSRLLDLKHLNSNFLAWDEHVERVTRRCEDLETLKLFCEDVTGRGLEAICRNIGTRLKNLQLLHSSVTNEDVVNCIRSCPNLTWLRVGGDLESVLRPAVEAREDMYPDAPENSLVLITEGCSTDLGDEEYDGEFDDLFSSSIDIRSDDDSAIDSEGALDYL